MLSVIVLNAFIRSVIMLVVMAPFQTLGWLALSLYSNNPFMKKTKNVQLF
jgi:hypothetical protein